jgi:hypothetical protein
VPILEFKSSVEPVGQLGARRARDFAGRARAVNDALGSLTAAVEKEGLAEPIRAMFLADEIEALIALDDVPRAERLIDMLEEAATAVQRGWALVQAGPLLRPAAGRQRRPRPGRTGGSPGTGSGGRRSAPA